MPLIIFFTVLHRSQGSSKDMSLKNATYIALIGISAALGLSLLGRIINFFNSYILHTLVWHVPLIIFFYALYKKQGDGKAG